MKISAFALCFYALCTELRDSALAFAHGQTNQTKHHGLVPTPPPPGGGGFNIAMPSALCRGFGFVGAVLLVGSTCSPGGRGVLRAWGPVSWLPASSGAHPHAPSPRGPPRGSSSSPAQHCDLGHVFWRSPESQDFCASGVSGFGCVTRGPSAPRSEGESRHVPWAGSGRLISMVCMCVCVCVCVCVCMCVCVRAPLAPWDLHTPCFWPDEQFACPLPCPVAFRVSLCWQVCTPPEIVLRATR